MRIKELLWITFTLLFLSVQGQTQPETVPLMENLSLKPVQSYSARALPIFRVYLQPLSNKNWCIPENFVITGIDSLWKTDCGASGIITTVQDSCITFSTVNITDRYRDTLCFTLLSFTGEIIPFKLDVIVNPPYLLPFIEDFSGTTVYPDPYKWQDRDVFINTTLAMHPPSLGVATFDGINAVGDPYHSGYGTSDYLTSNFINLQGEFDAHIRFWYQARGLGFKSYPRLKDSLVLQFKNPTGTWKSVWSTPGIGNSPVQDFKSVSIRIPPAYLSDEFQFRFVNYSDNDGMLSFWHLDYIFITDGEISPDGIQDVAFTEPAQSILTPYRSMPYNQFKGKADKYIRDSIKILLFNHYNTTQLANPSRYIVSSKNGQTTELLNETLLEVPPTVDENQRNLQPGRHVFHNKIKLRSSALIPNLENLNFNSDAEFQLISEMTYDNAGEPIQLNSNNITQYEAGFSDFYAYDDGTAEVGLYIAAGSILPTILQKFTLEKEDTLKAVRFFFPHIRPDVSRQRYRIVIYQGELNEESEPIYEATYNGAIFASTYYDTLNGFTTFALKVDGRDTGLVIPAGDFYVGWKQVSSNTQFGIYIGYDKNSPQVSASGKILYTNNGSTWLEYNGVSGALMIRPVFGSTQPISTSLPLVKTVDEVKIYPNPSRNYIIISGDQLSTTESRISIYSSLGLEVINTDYRKKININNLPSGKYFLRIKNKAGIVTHYGTFMVIK